VLILIGVAAVVALGLCALALTLLALVL